MARWDRSQPTAIPEWFFEAVETPSEPAAVEVEECDVVWRAWDAPADKRGLLLIHGMNAPTLRHGVIAGELSWILEDNAGMRSILERLGGTVTKRYRLYEKSLGGS